MRRIAVVCVALALAASAGRVLATAQAQAGRDIPPPLDVIAPPADAVRSPSGLASRVIKPGTGTAHPGPSSRVAVIYTGWTTDGAMFDSSVPSGKPLTIGLNETIRGWTEGLQLMVEGETRRFWIPSRLAYDGQAGQPRGMLVFDVQLVAIKPEPDPAPADVAAPPANAYKTASGIASKILKAGTGTVHPTATSTVTIHYTGWTTDGTMFNSSILGDGPVTLALDGAIQGWTEGVQLMVVGEKRRFWIPGSLAYDNSTRAGAPKGMLVFDIELIAIER